MMTYPVSCERENTSKMKILRGKKCFYVNNRSVLKQLVELKSFQATVAQHCAKLESSEPETV